MLSPNLEALLAASACHYGEMDCQSDGVGLGLASPPVTAACWLQRRGTLVGDPVQRVLDLLHPLALWAQVALELIGPPSDALERHPVLVRYTENSE